MNIFIYAMIILLVIVLVPYIIPVVLVALLGFVIYVLYQKHKIEKEAKTMEDQFQDFMNDGFTSTNDTFEQSQFSDDYQQDVIDVEYSEEEVDGDK